MRTRLWLALGVLGWLAIAAASCSKDNSGAAGALTRPLAPIAATPAPPDSNPGGPHPHPGGPKPPTPPVTFVSADSAAAGDSVATRWQLFNSSHRPVTMPWFLTSGRTWPGFPKSGSVALGARGTQLLLVGVHVPDTAAAGPNPLHMTVTQSDGTTANADGAIQISGS